LRAHGYEVIDADAVVRELQEVGGALYIAIRDTFGEAYFLKMVIWIVPSLAL
jgi:dephospho-CoA kinase